MKSFFLSGLAAALAVCASQPAHANDRYAERPPVMVSPDLSAPWVVQLNGTARPSGALGLLFGPRVAVPALRTAALARAGNGLAVAGEDEHPPVNPIYLPQQVRYQTKEKPGTIVIDTHDNFLYLVGRNGEARRYGVGTGKPGFEWAGTHAITRKAVWPDWRPPGEMVVRERAKGHILPEWMAGGPANPLGARALYIGSTEYRIHGTNQPWTIGGAVSSGCIRMRNQDVVDLYGRVDVGAKVIVM